MIRRDPASIYRVVDGVAQRNCKDCTQWFAATPEFFHPCCMAKDGLHVRCKTCHNKRTNRTQRELRARRAALNGLAA